MEVGGEGVSQGKASTYEFWEVTIQSTTAVKVEYCYLIICLSLLELTPLNNPGANDSYMLNLT